MASPLGPGGPCLHCREGWASNGRGLMGTRRGKVEKGETWLESLVWCWCLLGEGTLPYQHHLHAPPGTHGTSQAAKQG